MVLGFQNIRDFHYIEHHVHMSLYAVALNLALSEVQICSSPSALMVAYPKTFDHIVYMSTDTLVLAYSSNTI